MKKFKIKNKEIEKYLAGKNPSFPKYTTLLLNLINRTAKGTGPKIVGQMSDLIQEFEGDSFNEWEIWYKNIRPNSVDAATEVVCKMLENFKEAIELINRDMVKRWIEDLVLTKTFAGLRFQSVIIQKIAEEKKQTWRLANPEEEAKGIDGFIGDTAVSVKPSTYKSKTELVENIQGSIIYYDKKKDGIIVEFDF